MQFWFDKVIAATRQHVNKEKSKTSYAAEPLPKAQANLCFNFLKKAWQDGRYSLIAEIKKHDPFVGAFADYSASAIAKAYDNGGATCLAIPTLPDLFHGDIEHIKQARSATNLPILQKDCVLDIFQIHQAAALGANAVMLPVRALDDQSLQEFEKQADALGLDVFALIFDENDLTRCLELLYTPLVLCNNRHPETGNISTDNTIELAQHMPKDRLLISDAGITTPQIMGFLGKRGASSFVIGSTLLKEHDIVDATKEFLVACAEFSENVQSNLFRI